MSSKKKRSLKQGQRQKLRYRLLIAGGISLCVAGAGLMIWLQVSKPEETSAAVMVTLSQDNLPHDMNVEALVIAPQDSALRGGRYKIAKPLSQTPVLSAP
jgi:hypothetical protein